MGGKATVIGEIRALSQCGRGTSSVLTKHRSGLQQCKLAKARKRSDTSRAEPVDGAINGFGPACDWDGKTKLERLRYSSGKLVFEIRLERVRGRGQTLDSARFSVVSHRV